MGGNVQHLKLSDTVLTTTDEIAQTLAETFAHRSSLDNCLPQFIPLKHRHEKQKLKFYSEIHNNEDYNQLFSMEELHRSLNRSRDTAVGPDKIHYQFLKHLSESSLRVLLHAFNKIWQTGQIPSSWQEATVIPIPKPGKDHSNPTNYRPIALTSCICKTMERMVNDRLGWTLERESLISEYQCGFRRGRSTLDHLVRFETFLRNAFIRKQHAVAVFFDLEKAYDTTWRYGIMHDLGIRGRLPIFIASFLSNRHFRVRIGTVLSDPHDQELGVPQGSVLSVTLFSLKINSVANSIPRGVTCSMHVDDLLVCYSGKNMATIERQLQLCLNKVHNWSVANGFKFSKSKTVCMHFCHLRTLHPNPSLTMDGDPIKVVKEMRFLGLVFDSKLSLLPHIRALKARCLKALDVLKVLAATEWGADSTILLQLYRALVRAKLDYGSIVYGSARKSYIKLLDPVHHQGLRLSLGVFRTSPIQSLYVEAREPSLENRRLKQSLQYTVKLKPNPLNPAHACVFHPEYQFLYDSKPTSIRPLGLRVSPHLQGLGVELDNVAFNYVSDTPPWELERPNIIPELAASRKSDTPPITYHDQYLTIRNRFPRHIPFYTDGSKDAERVSVAAVLINHSYGHRIQDHSSIFTAEARAILLALECIEHFNRKRFVIFTDSMSCLQALDHLKIDHPIIEQIISELMSLKTLGFDIHLCWLPGHVGILGNERADRAKVARRTDMQPCLIPPSDFKPIIHKHITAIWQSTWDESPLNKLHEITPIVSEPCTHHLSTRRDQSVFNRCRIGHSRLTHEFLLKGEPPPECIPCNCPLTIKHLLIECVDFNDVRQRFYQVPSLQDLFKTVKPEVSLEFLKAAALYRLL